MAPRGCPPAPLGVPGAVGAGGGVPVAWVRALPPVKSPLLDSAQTVVLGRIKEFQLKVAAPGIEATFKVRWRDAALGPSSWYRRALGGHRLHCERWHVRLMRSDRTEMVSLPRSPRVGLSCFCLLSSPCLRPVCACMCPLIQINPCAGSRDGGGSGGQELPVTTSRVASRVARMTNPIAV